MKFTKILVVLISLAAAVAVSVQAQDLRDQAIDRLAEMSASQISTTHPKRVLVSPLQNCLRETSICSQLETALNTALAKISPQLFSRDEVNRALAKRRLMEIDAYDGTVLRWIASDLRADLLVTEDLLWNPGINGISTEIIDVAKEQSLGGYRVQFVSVSASDQPVVVKDDKSGVSLIVFYSASSSIKVPTCSSCPAPSLTAQSDALLRERFRGVIPLRVTVTPEGVAKQIIPIGTLNPLLTQKAIDTVREWHFHPAIGADGKPFAARSSVEVTFRLE
jgi:hypothetical protein